MRSNIGIMQGRLTEPKGRGIQFFPFDNWEKEFYLGQEIGLDEIEFIFDYDNYEQNPLWTDEGLQQLDDVIKKTGVRVNAVCFDYFMRRPFFKKQGEERIKLLEENSKVINRVLLSMKKLGIRLLECPLVDDSSMKTQEEKDSFRNWLLSVINSTSSSIKFGLETDLPPADFLRYIQSFENNRLGANYDSGNSSGLGYDLYEEVTTLGKYIFNIHIKDRKYQGTTVELGTGSANFDALFRGLKEINYTHSFILQAARGVEGNEKNNILIQKNFVEQLMREYSL